MYQSMTKGFFFFLRLSGTFCFMMNYDITNIEILIVTNTYTILFYFVMNYDITNIEILKVTNTYINLNYHSLQHHQLLDNV